VRRYTKAGAGSATLSMAYAAARMAEACLRGLSGEPDVYECTYVASSVTELPFFSTKVGRCRLTVSEPELKARLVSAISA
jgi:malate/lactate dehydrogenase